MDSPQNHYSDLKQEEPSGAEQGGGGEGGGGGDRPVIRLYISPCLSITSIVLRTVIRIWWPVGVLLSEVLTPVDRPPAGAYYVLCRPSHVRQRREMPTNWPGTVGNYFCSCSRLEVCWNKFQRHSQLVDVRGLTGLTGKIITQTSLAPRTVENSVQLESFCNVWLENKRISRNPDSVRWEERGERLCLQWNWDEDERGQSARWQDVEETVQNIAWSRSGQYTI